MTDPRIEAMACALYETEDGAGPDTWPPASEGTATAYRDDAEAYVKTIDKADDHVRVPVKFYEFVQELFNEKAAYCDLDDDDPESWSFTAREWESLRDGE